jgi:hypothetical protein
MEYLYLDDDDLNPADIFNSIDKDLNKGNVNAKINLNIRIHSNDIKDIISVLSRSSQHHERDLSRGIL